MELESLLQYLLPTEFFQYFDFKEIKEGDNKSLLLHLDEKPIKPEEHSDKELVSNGFDEPIRIQDFPIRDKAVFFLVRRRKWKDKNTGKVYSKNWNLTANSTSYTKGLFGQLPNKQ
jgi:hypothetical protein